MLWPLMTLESRFVSATKILTPYTCKCNLFYHFHRAWDQPRNLRTCTSLVLPAKRNFHPKGAFLVILGIECNRVLFWDLSRFRTERNEQKYRMWFTGNTHDMRSIGKLLTFTGSQVQVLSPDYSARYCQITSAKSIPFSEYASSGKPYSTYCQLTSNRNTAIIWFSALLPVSVPILIRAPFVCVFVNKRP